MVKHSEFSKYTFRTLRREGQKKSDPFFVIYNHRRALRARALKRLKKQKLKDQNKLMQAEKEAQKEENMKEWNKSMLREDSVWDYAWQVVKKQAKQQDSTITRTSQFDQKVQKLRLQIVCHFPVTQKLTLFQDKFTGFRHEQWEDEMDEMEGVEI